MSFATPALDHSLTSAILVKQDISMINSSLPAPSTAKLKEHTPTLPQINVNFVHSAVKTVLDPTKTSVKVAKPGTT
jgi:hypothetical protein